MAEARATLMRAGEAIPVGMNISFEEMVPVSFFVGVGDGRFANICRNYWDRFLRNGDGGVVFNDLFDEHPPHISMLKWFERSISSAETLAVSTNLGQAITEVARIAAPAQALGTAALLRKAADRIIRDLDFNVALEGNLGAVDSDGISLVAPGSYCPFPIGADVDGLPRSNMYVYSDATGTLCDLSIRRDAQWVIHWTCKGDIEPDRVQAHVYLYMGRVGSSSSTVRIEGGAGHHGVIFAVGAPHIPVMKPILVDGSQSYYSAPAGITGDAVYVGFPICAGSGSVKVEFCAHGHTA